jgi:hypothetical protein
MIKKKKMLLLINIFALKRLIIYCINICLRDLFVYDISFLVVIIVLVCQNKYEFQIYVGFIIDQLID